MEKRSTFSGSIGFILAAAGSAVGLGNIWRFPYLAAKDGGGLFLVIYLILALTFGFTLLTTEVSIGRKTKQSCLTAYGRIHKKWGFLGGLASLVPFIIMPYYCVIGGWVLKYALVFIVGRGAEAASDDFFTNFITGYADPIIYNIVFLLMTAVVIFLGVNKGIESLSKVLMPILFVMIIGIAIYSLTLSGGAETGGRTGIEGFGYYTIPNLDSVLNKEGFRDSIYHIVNQGEYQSLLSQYPLELTNVTDYSFLHATYHIDFFTYLFNYIGSINYGTLATVVMDAMGQLFYSISVAMGIMVTYGSYFKDKDNLIKSVNRIELFDTIVAFLAGVMIIPAVYVFLGSEGLGNAGPGLLFVAMPKIFAQMGVTGDILGAVFFLTVLFAALTSCISIMEAICSGMIDKGMSRSKATFVEGGIALVLSTVVCLGYNLLYFEFKLPNGAVGQLLDIMDYLSNNVLMPVLAIGTCILIGWVVKPKTVIDEATKNGEKFYRRWLYVGMIKVVAPVLLVILLLGSLGVY